MWAGVSAPSREPAHLLSRLGSSRRRSGDQEHRARHQARLPHSRSLLLPGREGWKLGSAGRGSPRPAERPQGRGGPSQERQWPYPRGEGWGGPGLHGPFSPPPCRPVPGGLDGSSSRSQGWTLGSPRALQSGTEIPPLPTGPSCRSARTSSSAFTWAPASRAVGHEGGWGG